MNCKPHNVKLPPLDCGEPIFKKKSDTYYYDPKTKKVYDVYRNFIGFGDYDKESKQLHITMDIKPPKGYTFAK